MILKTTVGVTLLGSREWRMPCAPGLPSSPWGATRLSLAPSPVQGTSGSQACPHDSCIPTQGVSGASEPGRGKSTHPGFHWGTMWERGKSRPAEHRGCGLRERVLEAAKSSSV